MDLYGAVTDFFDMLTYYIELLKSYLEDVDISGILNYLFFCIPEELRAIIIVFFLIMILLGIRNVLNR